MEEMYFVHVMCGEAFKEEQTGPLLTTTLVAHLVVCEHGKYDPNFQLLPESEAM